MLQFSVLLFLLFLFECVSNVYWVLLYTIQKYFNFHKLIAVFFVLAGE